MQITVMKTDFGKHPASKWAEVTVDQIVVVDDNASEAELQAGNKLKHELLDVLEKHHDVVQKHEQGKLDEDMGRLAVELKPEDDHVDAVLADIEKVTGASPFAPHFAKPEVKAYLRSLLVQHFQTSMDIERSWHADANSDHEVAVAYKKARELRGARAAHHFIDHFLAEGAE